MCTWNFTNHAVRKWSLNLAFKNSVSFFIRSLGTTDTLSCISPVSVPLSFPNQCSAYLGSFPHPSALPAEGWRAIPLFISPFLKPHWYPSASFMPCLSLETHFGLPWDLSIPQCSSLLLLTLRVLAGVWPFFESFGHLLAVLWGLSAPQG